ncbi:heavy-metal-associated domain-containing protein [Acholeplasma vituli]|uniref:Heavy-metal-associated domain-containing protein n=1 Tax=Paracholeplasma vituli TaxID=69473 RepID=A0ABT2PUH5_9MOLU|nr:heavy metal-associated domain-containing protein [Paracholeplasma vituli]MCU0104480.1 heavy-metal-associated domain-containing protein [Paracholeplasma vituli]
MKVLVVRLAGLHCGSCLNTIERISKELGAIKVDIELSTMIGKIYYESIDEETVIDTIEQYGYRAEKLASYDECEL